ncbi:MAG: hypothetical protein ACLR7Z_09315 [Bilophila wadsworthia]
MPVSVCPQAVLKFEYDDAVIGIGGTIGFGDDSPCCAGEVPCQARDCPLMTTRRIITRFRTFQLDGRRAMSLKSAS